ncbi:chemotaxis protein CheB [Rufibacter immobilis]|uniref:chemotaxis protein CheB n=1 Tax=Rufibacter immobilis TaxID=1348778 RepID=UPI0035ECE384
MQERKFEFIVIGGSAGSIGVAIQMIPALSGRFQVPILFVLHRNASSSSGFLSDILQPRTPLRIKEAEEKEKICPGTVYVAPADYHLLVETDFTFSLDASEKVHYSRPSIDVTFESLAAHYGEKLLGILLTGANADGARGMAEIARAGGLTIAQNPATAEVPTMPQAAINTGMVHHVFSTSEIISFLNNLVD